MVQETEVQSQVESYQRLKKRYLRLPCLTLSIIRYETRVKWSNPKNGVAPSRTPRCSSYWKGSLRVTLDYSLQLYLYIYIYIYIYIFCHPQAECFIVSQLFSVASHIGRFKLGLKPAQLYVRFSIILFSYRSTYVRSGIIRHYVVAFICLHFALADTRVLNSFEELCITWVADKNRIFGFKILTNQPTSLICSDSIY